MKRIIDSKNAPAAVGAYSQAVEVNGTIYLSGQLPINPQTGKFISDDICDQTRQAMDNIKAILKEENLSMENLVKVTVLLSDINNFKAFNEIYSTYFKKDFPARAAYEVSNLPLGAKIEIASIAVK